jgi:hypothetical protein
VVAARPVGVTAATAWTTSRPCWGLDRPRAVLVATAGAWLGGGGSHGVPRASGLGSAAAGQWARGVPGRCWGPAARPWQHRLPLPAGDRRALAGTRHPVWTLYRDLPAYRQQPDPTVTAQRPAALAARGAPAPPGHRCLRGGSGCPAHPAARLRVLERPALPVPHNGSENDRRARVQQRTIRAGPRRAAGRRWRDTFRQSQDNVSPTRTVVLGVPQRSGSGSAGATAAR